MRDEYKQFYSYLGARWGGGGSVHLEFIADGLPLHVEAVQDNQAIPFWIAQKMNEAQLAEVEALLAVAKPHREAQDAAIAEMLAAEGE